MGSAYFENFQIIDLSELKKKLASRATGKMPHHQIAGCQMRFGLVWFYGISTTVDYLMPNLLLYK